MVHGKKEHLYLLMFFVIMWNLYPYLLLALVYVDISISLFGTCAILYSIVNIRSFLLSCRFSCHVHYYSCDTGIFWVILFDKSCCFYFLNLFQIWDILYWYSLHAAHAYSNCDLTWISRPAFGVHVGNYNSEWSLIFAFVKIWCERLCVGW